MHVQLLLNNRGVFSWLEMRETFGHCSVSKAAPLLFDFGWNASDILLFKSSSSYFGTNKGLL